MSKQTNAFQKAILFIHEQLKGTGTKVTESFYLPESNISEKIDREIDVLIENEEGGVVKRIAIECRDRSDKDDIIWVDGLIGKFRNLKVDKVIAVSSSGFSKSALLKAQANDIELRTPQEIEKVDWNEEFVKIGMAELRFDFEIKEINAETDVGLLIKLTDSDKVIFEGRNETFVQFFGVFTGSFLIKTLKEKLDQKKMEVYKTKADLFKTIEFELKVPILNFYLIRLDSPVPIAFLIVNVIAFPLVKELSTKHYNYDNSIISRADSEVDGNKSSRIFVAQTQKNQNVNLNISIDNKVKKAGRRTKSK